ncbi:MAG TPA: siderophore-interacting protein, partial [Mycobacteriales bacterium]
MRHGPPAPTDGEDVAVNRERFLTAESADPGKVRDTILASWWRSRELNVAADRIELPYIRDPEIDSPLTRSAEPVLRTLRDQLDGQQVSIVLTDSSGLVLVRLTAGDELERHLDKVMLAPGFSYAEEFVGTN